MSLGITYKIFQCYRHGTIAYNTKSHFLKLCIQTWQAICGVSKKKLLDIFILSKEYHLNSEVFIYIE